MAARHEKRRKGKRDLGVGQVDARQVALEMVDADQWDSPAERQRLGGRDPHKKGTHQARSGRHRNCAQIPPVIPASRRARGDDGRHSLEVGPAGQFRYDAAEPGVEIDLAGHHGRAHR